MPEGIPGLHVGLRRKTLTKKMLLFLLLLQYYRSVAPFRWNWGGRFCWPPESGYTVGEVRVGRFHRPSRMLLLPWLLICVTFRLNTLARGFRRCVDCSPLIAAAGTKPGHEQAVRPYIARACIVVSILIE